MKKSLLALTLLAASPYPAFAAEGVSYNYVQGGYVATGDNNDADGWGVDGSVAVHSNFHIFGAFSNREIAGTGIDFDQWHVGLGYNHEIAPRVDLVTRVAYEKFDYGSGFFVADGWSAEVGARAALASRFEGYAMAGYEDYGNVWGYDIDGNFYGRLGAQVKFNQNWGLSGDIKFADGDRQWFVGPRLTW